MTARARGSDRHRSRAGSRRRLQRASRISRRFANAVTPASSSKANCASKPVEPVWPPRRAANQSQTPRRRGTRRCRARANSVQRRLPRRSCRACRARRARRVLERAGTPALVEQALTGCWRWFSRIVKSREAQARRAPRSRRRSSPPRPPARSIPSRRCRTGRTRETVRAPAGRPATPAESGSA